MISKRAHKRVYEPPINAMLRNKELCHDVSVVEISRSGLRFVSEAKYKKGDKLRFDINDSNINLSINIKAKVINEYSSDADGLHTYGVRFFRVFYWYEKKCIDEQLVYTSRNRDGALSDNVSLVIAKKAEKNH